MTIFPVIEEVPVLWPERPDPQIIAVRVNRLLPHIGKELCGDLLLAKRAHHDENRNIEQTPGKWVVLDSSVAESADVIIDIGRDDEVAAFRTASDLTPGGERQTWHCRLGDDIRTLYLSFLQLADFQFGCHMKPIHAKRRNAASPS
ncbi:hypothetical protein [Rhizobium sp. 12,4]|uniref:hypothetical protein n=1 Tax=Rhizobium sp. 12,4 TaxID=3405135 RepID=UPI003D34EBB3